MYSRTRDSFFFFFLKLHVFTGTPWWLSTTLIQRPPWKNLRKPPPIPPEHHATSPTILHATLSAPSIPANNSASSAATGRRSNQHTLASAPPGRDPRRGARTTPPARSPALPRTRRASSSAPRSPAGSPDPPTATHPRGAQHRLVRPRRLQGRTAYSTRRAAHH